MLKDLQHPSTVLNGVELVHEGISGAIQELWALASDVDSEMWNRLRCVIDNLNKAQGATEATMDALGQLINA